MLLCLADVFSYGEEFEKGAAARLLLGGAKIPWTSLPYHIYEGGGFVQSHLDAIFFLVLGPSVLALKLTSLFWNIAILLMGWRCLDEHVGRSSARAFAVLFVFAPVGFQKLSLLSLGIHFEALWFVLAIVHFTARIMTSDKSELLDWFLLGLVVGFGFFFSLQVAVFAAVAGAFLLYTSWRSLNGSGGLIASLGLVLGLTPWLVMFGHWGPKVFDVHGSSVGADLRQALGNVRASVGSIFRGRDLLDLCALAVLWLAPLLGLLALLTSQLRSSRRMIWLVLASLAVFLCVYLASGFAVGEIYHYFRLNRTAPAWMLATLLCSVGLAALWDSERKASRVCGAAILVLLFAAGLRGTWRTCARGSPATPLENIGLLARTKGYAYPAYFSQLWPRLEGDERKRVEVLRRVPESSATMLDFALAQASASSKPRSFQALAQLATPRVESFVVGLGSQFEKQGAATIDERVALARTAPAELADAALEAVGRYGSGFLITGVRLHQELEVGARLSLTQPYYRGLGWRVYHCRGDIKDDPYWRSANVPYAFAPARARAFLDQVSGERRAWLEEGYLAAQKENSLR